MADRSIKLFSGNANPRLAQKIADNLGMSLGKAQVGRFSDGEVAVEIAENVRGQEVFIIQPTYGGCHQTGFGGFDYGSYSVFWLRQAGSSAAFGAGADYRQGGGKNDQHRWH